MAQGTSLHIALNNVSPDVYPGATPLSGCINDANDMRQIALAQGFQTHALTDESATADAVIDMLSISARRMRAGDLMLVTYSGHGGSIIDHDGDEQDSRDETWCLYDRMLLDDELAAIWPQFAPGVRILVLSDSCHSGTVLRQVRLPDPGLSSLVAPSSRLPEANAVAQPGKPGRRAIAPPVPAAPALTAAALIPPRALRNMVEAASNGIRARAADRHIRPRAMPPKATLSALEADPQIYTTVRALSRASRNLPVQASVILISGCRDDQLSADGDRNGLFTEKLREVWADGAFTGSHEEFHSAILARLPRDQSPELTVTGPDDQAFLNQRPFTITTNAANEPVSSALWVRGADQVPQDGPPPEFQVNAGPNSYFIFEIASDPALFDTAQAGPQRRETNFYGSWSDSPHRSGASYVLPDEVWDRMKGEPCLYYRIGSTANAQGWDNYMVSTPDEQAEFAPRLVIVPASAEPGDAGPQISGPDRLAAMDSAPRFDIDMAGAPYYIVEVATRPELFDTANAQSVRDSSNFYGSWSDGPLLSAPGYALPEAVWRQIDLGGGLLYYRAGTTRSAQWDDYRVTTPDHDAARAPFIVVD